MTTMIRHRYAQLGLLWLLAVVLAASPAYAAWSYEYTDNFETDKALIDSSAHAPFWTPGTSPLPEPYLYYIDTSSGRGIAFIDYREQPAELAYCFPLGTAQGQRVVKGTLEVDVTYPSNETISQYNPGNLAYRVSSDGVAWSALADLSAGHHSLSISSTGGTCYITFTGTRAVIDNLRVWLESPSATIRVPGNYPTIQAAIDAAGGGDVIEVASGTYSGTGYYDIDFRGKAITVRSADGPERTIIDCGAATSGDGHRGFYFHRGEDADSLLTGFTIKGGRIFGTTIPSSTSNWSASSSHPIGGGVYCEFSSPTIADCIITDCGAELGGGIGVVGGDPVITDCAITGCFAGGLGTSSTGGQGGGIGLIGRSGATIINTLIEDNSGYYDSQGAGLYCFESTATVSGCLIAGNFAPGNLAGGGAYCVGARTDVLFQNCIFSSNSANVGAGLYTEWNSSYGSSSQRCSVTVVNCTIAQNELAGSSSWPYPGGGIESDGTDILVNSSIVWHNDGKALAISSAPSHEPVTYSNIQGGYIGEGNLNEDPLFASLGSEDYHLQSAHGRYNPQTERWVTDGRTSPCLDAGDPSISPTDEPTPNGGRINSGAYGATREASKGPQHFTYHVNASGGRDTNNGLSKLSAFKTIQKAIDKASTGDTVLVWPGTYQEDLFFSGKAITVQSAADAAVIVAEEAYAFSFYYAESSKSLVSNFIIRGCYEGAIYCDHGASPILKNLTIVDNEFGIAAYNGSDPYIVNCILWGNASGDLWDCTAYYSCIEHGSADASSGNIRVDPGFVDPDDHDYHLMSPYGRYVSASGTWATDSSLSPCIDAGDDEEYPRAERTPNGNRINMGAYGDTPYASLSGWPPY